MQPTTPSHQKLKSYSTWSIGESLVYGHSTSLEVDSTSIFWLFSGYFDPLLISCLMNFHLDYCRNGLSFGYWERDTSSAVWSSTFFHQSQPWNETLKGALSALRFWKSKRWVLVAVRAMISWCFWFSSLLLSPLFGAEISRNQIC